MSRLLFLSFVLLACAITANAQTISPSTVVFMGHVESLEWSPDGQSLAIQGEGGTRIFNFDNQLIGYLEENDYVPPNASFDSYSQSWGVGVSWDTESKNLVAPYYDILESRFGIKVWDAETETPIFNYTLSTDNTDIDWNKNTHEVAISYRSPQEGAYEFWDITIVNIDENTGFAFAVSEIPINDIAWSPNGIFLATGNADGRVDIWDTSQRDLIQVNPFTGTPPPKETLTTLWGHSSAVNAVAWNNDGSLLASASSDGSIRIWDINTHETIQIFENRSGINSIDWDSTGAFLASGSEDAIIRIWNITTRELVTELEGHQDAITDLDWHPDNTKIATSSKDNRVRVWDLNLE